MFGAQDNPQASNDDPAMLDNVKQLATQPVGQVEPPQPQQSVQQTYGSPAQPTSPVTPQTAHAVPAQGFSSTPLPPAQQHPPVDHNASQLPPQDPAPSPVPPPADPVQSTPPVTPYQPPSTDGTPKDSTNVTDDSSADPQHLAGMKQKALDHLEPLVDHLDGTPEETFKTTMMMIQANDNHTLLEKALEAAKGIGDDKERAQALLDIINEINYFAQNNSSS